MGILSTTGGPGSTPNSTPPPPPPPATTTIDFTNQFGTVNLTNAGIVSKGSELQSYNGILAPPHRSLGSVNFSAGAFTGASILTGGTFSSAGSSFNLISGAANFGQPPKGNIFTGSFVGPVTWTLVSQTGKYTDNFTLSGAFSGTLYTGAAVTGTTTQNITLYTDCLLYTSDPCRGPDGSHRTRCSARRIRGKFDSGAGGGGKHAGHQCSRPAGERGQHTSSHPAICFDRPGGGRRAGSGTGNRGNPGQQPHQQSQFRMQSEQSGRCLLYTSRCV